MIYLKYLKYVLRHRWFVFVECCKSRIVWLGLVHDLSKFRLDELIPYARHFNGNIKKGRDSTGYYKPVDTGDSAFDFAWLLHQKRNKHHWQWWILPNDEDGLVILDMPMKYRKEMLADWRGAGRAQGTLDNKAWYMKNGDKMQLHPNTRRWVEEQLGINKFSKWDGKALEALTSK